ncbi:MAG: S9 family peptidase [Candidatus Polarisedimenticolia bacterium]
MPHDQQRPTGGRRKATNGVVAALAIALFALPAFAGDAKRAFTIEDFYKVKSPAGPVLSPDGATLVYSLQTKDLGRGKAQSDLYRVPAAGGPATRLTFTDDQSETSPAFSPDGKLISFVAKRGENQGIWLLPTDGGEARQLVALSTGIDAPVWSPDGKYIAFASEIHPECGADDACNKKLDTWRAKGPLKAHVADELLYRHWTQWYDGKVSHVLLVEVATGKVRDLTPGDREAPVFSLGGAAGGYAFSPDGKELAYTRNPDPKDTLARSTNSDIWIVPVAPGPDGATQPATDVTAGNKAWDGDPLYSPDGRWIAYRRQLQPGYESDLFRLVLYDRAAKTSRVLTPNFDNWVDSAAWLADSTGLVFKAEEGGRSPLYRVLLAGGAPEKLATFATIDDFVLPKDGRAAFVLHRAIAEPPELWRLDLAGKTAPLRLTTHNKALEDEVDIRPAEEAFIAGAGGAKVHTFVVKPHNFDPNKKYPVILNIHGGPQSQWADSFRGDWQVYPGAGYVVVFPNPHGSTGFGQAYTASISGDWAGAPMEDVAKVTDWIEKQPWADKDRIGAMGWSWGGYAVNWLQGTTTRYKALASMMGVFDLPSKFGATEELWFPTWDLKGTPWTSDQYEKFNPSRNVKNFKTPELVITGELDYRIAYTQGLMAFTYLRSMNVPAKLVVFPNAGHWPNWYEMALYYTAHLEWFHQYLGGDPAPWSSDDFAANKVFDFETGQRRK